MPRNAARLDRDSGPYVVETERQQMLQGIDDLEKEGFRRVYRLISVEELEAATVVREPL